MLRCLLGVSESWNSVGWDLKTSRREFLFFFIKKAGLGPLEVLFTLI
jgi:hypothetical protein